MGLQRTLGLQRYETIWIWLHKLLTAMVRPGPERLSGTVEVDETFIEAKRPGKSASDASDKSLVLIAVEDKDNKIGRIRFRRIQDASAESLIPAVKDSVEAGSVLRTDGWSGYGQLASNGYEHIVVRKSAHVGENMLPLADRVAEFLKRWLQGTHQGDLLESHLDYYLGQYTFLFNRRTSQSRGQLFFRLIQQAASILPVTGKDIPGGRHYP